MVKVKTTMELDNEQFLKYAKFLAWLKRDKKKKAKQEQTKGSF